MKIKISSLPKELQASIRKEVLSRDIRSRDVDFNDAEWEELPMVSGPKERVGQAEPAKYYSAFTQKYNKI